MLLQPGRRRGRVPAHRIGRGQARWVDAGTTDQFMEAIGVPGGAIRASVGLASNIEDVQRLLALLEQTYRDRHRVSATRSSNR